MKKLIEIICLLKKLVNDDLVNIIISYYFRKVSHKKCLKCQNFLVELIDEDYHKYEYPFDNNFKGINDLFHTFKELHYEQYICIYCDLVYIKCTECDNFLQNIKCDLCCAINDIDEVMKTNPMLLDENDNELGTLKEMLDNKKIKLKDDEREHFFPIKKTDDSLYPTNTENESENESESEASEDYYNFPVYYWDLTKCNSYFYPHMFDATHNHFIDERFETYWKCNNCNKLFIMEGN